MPFPHVSLIQTFYSRLCFILALSLIVSGSAFAIDEDNPIHASGDKEVWNRTANRVELFGHAIVRQTGESLSADYIVLDQITHMLDAHGNCIYISGDTVIYGEEMHFNLDTRTGTVVGGRVSTDRFTLSGERINRLSPTRFQTHWGEYSTCRDCPQSWTMQARDVDMEIEGYAHLSNVTVKVADTPGVWFPYLILPMKTQRQSGFLFPKYTLNSTNGFMFVQPFFWAINRSADMTIGAGRYTDRGNRVEWEGRYALSDRSTGRANVYYLNDQKFADSGPNGDGQFNPSGNPNRWAIDVAQVQELPWHFEEKLRILDVSDNYYPFYFNDLKVQPDAFLGSSLNLNYSSSEVSANLGGERYRNLLNLSTDARSFDQGTVQPFPRFDVTTNDKFLFGMPIVGGISLGLVNFTRPLGPFDQDVLAASGQTPVDPIRKATRMSIMPSLYTVVTPIPGLSLVPSLQYFGYYYSFHQQTSPTGVLYGDLFRSYALLQLSLETQIERIFTTSDPEVPREKHLIRPILTYSNIPFLQQDAQHPFLQQINYATGKGLFGYNFDDDDIVPRDTGPSTTSNYYVPLGNSLTYGLKTQLVERHETVMENGKPNPNVPATYRVPIEFSAGQTFNFREFQVDVGNPQPFSRLFANLKTNHREKLLTDTTYYYYPYEPGIRSAVTTAISYVLERSKHQRILLFDRSLFVNYNWNQVGYTGNNSTGSNSQSASGGINFSINDYILPSALANYDFVLHQLTTWGVNLQFQSPSQCWKINTGLTFDLTRGRSFDGPTITLNLTGNGFEGVNEISSQGTQGAGPR